MHCVSLLINEHEKEFHAHVRTDLRIAGSAAECVGLCETLRFRGHSSLTTHVRHTYTNPGLFRSTSQHPEHVCVCAHADVLKRENEREQCLLFIQAALSAVSEAQTSGTITVTVTRHQRDDSGTEATASQPRPAVEVKGHQHWRQHRNPWRQHRNP